MANSLKRVAIAGSSGFVGSALCNGFRKLNSEIIPILRKTNDNRQLTFDQIEKKSLPNNIDVLINVCGSNLFNSIRLNKDEIFESRVKTNLILRNAILKCEKPPHTLITISGVGLYKAEDSIIHDEKSDKYQNDFWSHLINEWEDASFLPSHIKTRRIVIRSGVVLDGKGGMIKRLYPQFYFGLGSFLGNGKNYMPWVMLSDLVSLFIFCAQNEAIEGVVNAAAPEFITNKYFSKTYANKLNRPCVLSLPKNVIKLVLGVERRDLLLNSLKVYSQKALDAGFKFNFPDIKSACDELVK